MIKAFRAGVCGGFVANLATWRRRQTFGYGFDRTVNFFYSVGSWGEVAQNVPLFCGFQVWGDGLCFAVRMNC